MNKKQTRKRESEMRRQVAKWMTDRGLPLVLYDKLKSHNSKLLHNLVCVGIVASPAQLWDLHTDLGSPLMHKARTGPRSPLMHKAGAEASVSKEYREPTIEQLNEYFSPLISTTSVPYQKMF